MHRRAFVRLPAAVASLKATALGTAKRVGEAIEVSVTHSLDPKLYDLPLTARTSAGRLEVGAIPPTERDADTGRATRDRQFYVMYRIAPNGGVARLVRGK